MISAVSAVSSVSSVAASYSVPSIAPANAVDSTAPSIVAQTESPDQIRQDSIDVMDHYGVAPAYAAAVAYYAPAFVANHNADVVSAVAPIVRYERSAATGGFIDQRA